MTDARTTEAVFNSLLAAELRRLSPRWRAENIITAEATNVVENKKLRLDILILLGDSVPVSIETEWYPATGVDQDARDRLGLKLRGPSFKIETALAVRLDDNLRTLPQEFLGKAIRKAKYEYCLYTLNLDDKPVRWPVYGWISVSLAQLSDAIEYSALSERKLTEATDLVEFSIEQAAGDIRHATRRAPDLLSDLASLLHQEEAEQTTKMAVAIVANAFMQHASLAGLKDPNTGRAIRALAECDDSYSLIKEWRHILSINFWPIFNIASELIRVFAVRLEVFQRIILNFQELTSKLIKLGATTMHDMAGQVFQRMISDRKYLATFYTLPTSAVFLAELSVEPIAVDWSDTEAVKEVQIVDFACGTGTLISSAYQAIQRKVRRAGLDDSPLHRHMLEHSLVAADIMPAAVHLTASILSASHPTEFFDKTRVMLLPYGEYSLDGVPKTAIGSLDLILENAARDLFGVGYTVSGVANNTVTTDTEIGSESFDLIIMNPPFTRPTGNEAKKIGVPVPCFAGFNTTEQEQRAMSVQLARINRELRKIRRSWRFTDGSKHPGIVAGDGRAGLASNFIDLAHEKLVLGGVLALVLPFTFVQGVAWQKSRELLHTHYRDIKVLAIATLGSHDRAFSADTGMAEVLVIAKKTNEKLIDNKVTYINLHARPKHPLEATLLASRIRAAIESNVKVLRYSDDPNSDAVGNLITGDITTGSCAGIRSAAIADSMLAFTQKGQLRLPRLTRKFKLPMVQLGQIGERGIYHASISWHQPPRPFARVPWSDSTYAEYPSLWAHDAKLESRLVVSPDTQLIPNPDFYEMAIDLWKQYSSHLHLNRDFRVNSQPLAACMTKDKTLGGTAWPNFCLDDEKWESLIALWLNTSLGLMIFWWLGTRQQQGRSRLSISKNPDLMVIDPRQLSDGQLELTQQIYQETLDKDFLPANEVYRDHTRKELDRAMLIDVLGLPDSVIEALETLRYLWCHEPSVHGGKYTRPN